MDHESFPEAKKEAERWEDAEYSCSVIEFNWCLDTQVDDLLHHNVFLSGDYKGSWNRPATTSDFDAPKQHNFYCHNPVYTDKTCAPEGGSSIMVLLPVANINEQARECKKRGVPVPTEEEMVAAGREAVLHGFKEAGKDISGHRERIRHHSVAVARAVQHQARRRVWALARAHAARRLPPARAHGHPAAGLAGG